MTPTSHNDEEQKKMVVSQFDTDVQMADYTIQMSDMVAGSGNSSTVATNEMHQETGSVAKAAAILIPFVCTKCKYLFLPKHQLMANHLLHCEGFCRDCSGLSCKTGSCPAHRENYHECDLCPRVFGSVGERDAHVKDQPRFCWYGDPTKLDRYEALTAEHKEETNLLHAVLWCYAARQYC